MSENETIKYYTKTQDEVLSILNTTIDGLSQSEAGNRLKENGENKLDEGKKKTVLIIFLSQFKNIMIWVLMAAALISALMGEAIDAIVIGIVILLNSILGTIQEARAEQALAALNSMAAPTARVLRDGNTTIIPASQLVVGDIVHIEAGDSVPADLRLFETASLMAEESALTGESVPVTKDANAICEPDSIPGDRINMAFMGTSISYGRAKGIVSTIGMNTQMGNIAHILAEPDDELTPLQKKLNEISKTISIGVLLIALVIFAVGILNGRETFEMFLTSVSLAVAAIPEGLVAVVTIVLALGMQKMARKGAIIRKLPAVETLGCTQVICSDKTGTLTLNKMTIQKIYTENNDDLIHKCMVICNDTQPDKNGVMVGDPTETAMIDYALKNGYTLSDITSKTREGEIPFDSDRKLMTVIADNRAWIKGAPDVLLDRCTKMIMDNDIVELTKEDRDIITLTNDNMAMDALRVIAFAYKDDDNYDLDNPEKVESNLTLIGLCGMIDPPRMEAKQAVLECRNAGIKPVMITGDHAITASAIAKELGILEEGQEVITGKEMQTMNDAELRMHFEKTSVYARVAPEHKVRIVNIWQESGAVVAMTGDGVNDAPALKKADIGIGMGITGTDVSKAASDMILTDDNFATIVHAVEEGRKVYQNIRKAVKFLLSSNMGEVIALLIATLLGIILLRPVQILWINLVTDTFPALALGMEPMESDVMKRKPRDAKEPFFNGRTWFTIVLHGSFEAGLALIAYMLGSRWGTDILGMTMAFLTLGLAQLFQSFGIRSERNSVFKIGLLKNKMMLLALLVSTFLQVIVVLVPPLREIFQLTMPTLLQWLTVLGLASMMLFITEIHKLIERLIYKKSIS